MMLRRFVRSVVVTGMVWSASVGTAGADPAGPTPYESTIVAIEPRVIGIDLRIIGGDSFLELTVDGGHDVTVLGYSGEPYLRFDPDGTVSQNRNSPAVYLNEDRYAATALPDRADPAADPDWEVLDDDGSWAWHDHRTHWMAPVPPLGLEPGDQVLDEQVDLLVDGVPVTVSIISTWIPDQSNLPAILGALLGLAAAGAAAAVRFGRSSTGGRSAMHTPGMLLTAAAVGALVIGLWHTRSLPSETAPPITDWALPLVALVAALWSGAAPRSSGAAIAGVVAGAELVVWAVLRRDVLRFPVLPTNAPFWLDRAVTTSVGVMGLALAVVWLVTLFGHPSTTVVATDLRPAP
ncbi:MAG: hypothetical protein RI958_3342 [Actinomycetota bacterium]